MNLNEAYELFRSDPKVVENKELFGRELLRYCRGFTRKKSRDAANITSESSWHSSEDASSDAILAVWDNLHKFIPNEGVQFTTWVGGVVKNHLSHAYRLHKNHAQISPTEEMLQHSPHIGINTKLSIQKLLSQLSEEDKAFVQMRLDGYSYEEIAAKVDKDPKWVDNHWQKVQKSLREKAFSG